MKKVLVILGHPSLDSFNRALAEKYAQGAKKAGKQVKMLYLSKMKFKPLMNQKWISKLEPDLVDAQKMMKWADHLVFVYPTWWAAPPALVKAFLERVLTPGFAYKYKKVKGRITVKRYFKGKSARLIATMDSPPLYYILYSKDPGYKMMKDVLQFTGVKPVKKTYFGSVKLSSEEERKLWLERAFDLGMVD